MRYCWSHLDNKRSMLVPAWISLGFGCVWGLWFLFQYGFFSTAPIAHSLTICILALVFVTCSFFIAFVVSRRYQIDASGITIQYPFQITKHFHWDQFTEIALCKIHYATASNKHILAIRCVIGEERHGPKQSIVAKERWTTPEYEIIHYRKIISIYHTLDRVAEFHSFCPHPLTDYRHLDDRP